VCGAGGERVLKALLSCSARLRVRGYITVLPMLIRDRELEKAYQIYVTDSLRLISENSAASAAYYSNRKMGQYPQMRFAELFDAKPAETRTAKDVIANIRKKLREVRE